MILQNLRRRVRWRRRATADPLTLVDEADGVLSAVARAVIVSQAMDHFKNSAASADELIGYAQFLLVDVRDPRNCFLKLQPLIMTRCSSTERADLVSIVRAVAGANGQTCDDERIVIDTLAKDLAGLYGARYFFLPPLDDEPLLIALEETAGAFSFFGFRTSRLGRFWPLAMTLSSLLDTLPLCGTAARRLASIDA